MIHFAFTKDSQLTLRHAYVGAIMRGTE